MQNIIDALRTAENGAFIIPAASVNPRAPVGPCKVLCNASVALQQRLDQCKMDSADGRPAWQNLQTEMETGINEQTPPYTKELVRAFLIPIAILADAERTNHPVQQERISGLENLTAPMIPTSAPAEEPAQAATPAKLKPGNRINKTARK
jgi:hypothetical protein